MQRISGIQEAFRWNQAGARADLGQRRGHDVRPVQPDEVPPPAGDRLVDRGHPEARGQHPVVRDRRIILAERARASSRASRCAPSAGFGGDELPDPSRRGHPFSSSSYSGMFIVPGTGTAPSLTTTIENVRRCECTARIRSQTSSMSNGCSGIKMTSAAPARPAVMPTPSGAPPHDLAHHHPVVALRGAVQAIDGIGGDLRRGPEPDAGVRSPDVVVDRLGDADHRDVGHRGGRPHRALAADHDEPIERMRVERSPDELRSSVDPRRLGPGRPEDRAAPREDPRTSSEASSVPSPSSTPRHP